MGKNYDNALLLLSIYATGQNNGSELINVIAFADYANHAIMTYDEFDNGVKYLIKNGLVKEKSKKLYIFDMFKDWVKSKNKKRFYVLKEVEMIESYLNKLDEENNIDTYNDIEININKTDFENSINEYVKN